MDTPTGVATLPPFYNGQGFAVDKLSPGKFEDFVFACLQSASDLFELTITGMPSGSGDGGFDVEAQTSARSESLVSSVSVNWILWARHLLQKSWPRSQPRLLWSAPT
jgi:hypothetical protein